MRVTIVVAALTALVIAGCRTQSRTLSEEFDTTRTVSLSGRVATLLLPPSHHAYVLIDVQTVTKAGRLVYGIQLTLVDGNTIAF